MNEIISPAYLRHIGDNIRSALKWSLFGILCGLAVGSAASIFGKLILLATSLRAAHPWILYTLPLCGLAIVGWYRLLGTRKPRGTNLVIEALREGKRLPPAMAPLIFVSTVLTHFAGGSAGREGAALQVGGSLGSTLASLLHFKKEDSRRAIMCGMSAAFSALFGTPLAATVMSMEISTVGIMYYSALVPCMLSALVAHFVAEEVFGLAESSLVLGEIPAFSARQMLLIVLLAICCSVVSALFCKIMHEVKHLETRFIVNDFLRAAAAGVLVILMTLVAGSQMYNGAGSQIIEKCLTDPAFRVFPAAFLIKIIFTAVTLGGGFQGGEIVPSLFVGATFGNFFAQLAGLPSPFASAVGAAAVFCGVTNCPITALLISFEMFGFGASNHFLLAIAITYLLSGNFGIWSAQMIRYSKFEPGRVDRTTH